MMNLDAIAAEVARRLNDPNRTPIVVRTEPLTEAEQQHTLALFHTIAPREQDRLLDIFEHVASLPEPERTRTFETFEIALDVVQEFAA